MTCTDCGAPLAPTDAFCGNCGHAREDVPAPPLAAEPATTAVSAGDLGRIASDYAKRVLTCDWKAPLRIAGLTLGSSLVLALVFGFASRPSSSSLHWGFKTTLAWIVWVWESTFGSNVVAGAKFDGSLPYLQNGANVSISSGGGLGAMPLTLTVVTLLIAAVAFRRAIAQSPNAVSALLLGLRAAILTAIPLFLVSLFVTIGVNDVANLLGVSSGDGSGPGSALGVWQSLSSDKDMSVSMSSTDAFFITIVLLIAVFAAVTLMRSAWFTGPFWGTVQRMLAAPLRGFGLLALALVVGGLAFELLIWLVQWNSSSAWGPGGHAPHLSFHQWLNGFAGVIAYAGNAGAMALGLGSLGKVGYQASADIGVSAGPFGQNTHPHASYGIAYFAHGDHFGWAVWTALAIAPAALLFVAWRISRPRTADGVSALTSLATWLVSLLLAVPVLAWAANLTFGGSGTMHATLLSSNAFNETVTASGSVGLSIAWCILLVFAYGLLVCLVVGFLRGAFRAKPSAQSSEAGTDPLSSPL